MVRVDLDTPVDVPLGVPIAVAIPSDPMLIGARFAVQAVVVGGAPNSVGIDLTNDLRIFVGGR